MPLEAAQAFAQAIKLNRDNPLIYNNLGLALFDMNRPDEAQACFCQAIELSPDYPEAYFNLGRILQKKNSLSEAEHCFRRTIELLPDHLYAYSRLAVVLIITNRFEEAESYLRQAIRLKPDYGDAYRKLGRVLKMMHRLDEAEAAYLRSIALSSPDKADDPLFGLGILYLLRGQYTKGWESYDLRRKLYHYPSPGIQYWRGENLAGRKILLYSEQGLGDTIQFVRYASEVAALGAKTAVRVQPPLQKLLAYSSANCEIYFQTDSQTKDYDFACSLHSLPFVFNTAEETIPTKIPYIRPSSEVTCKWHDALIKAAGEQPFRIGVVWAGNPKHHNDHNRSIPFDLFSTLFELSEASWLSLQVGDRAEDLTRTSCKIIDFSADLVDFFETAGLIQNLDLIITVDSSVAHLAGAMGKKTWILLPFAPDWRWQLDRDDSPWYPAVRLFRQNKIGDWQTVLTEIKTALPQFLTSINKDL